MKFADRMAWLLALLWFGMPLYPSFIALLPITPPGYSLLGPLPALVLLASVGCLTLLVLLLMVRDQGIAVLDDALFRAAFLYLGVTALTATLGLVPAVGWLFALIVACGAVGMRAIRVYGQIPHVSSAMSVALLSSSAIASAVALATLWLRRPAGLYTIGHGRAIGSFVVPGELAGYLGMLIPYAAALALATSRRSLRLFALAVLLIDVAAFGATFSRAGTVGLLIGFSFLAASFGRRALGVYLAASIIVVLAGLPFVVNLHHNPAENLNRLSIWQAAFRMMLLFPVWGVGPGGFAHVYPLLRLPGGEPQAYHAHNFLLTTAAESGMIGVAALCAFWWSFVRLFVKAYPHGSRYGRTVALGIAGGFCATWIQSMADVVQILFLGLWVPFMGLALVALETPEPTAPAS